MHNRRVRHATRHRWIFALLCCLALVGQLLLPTLHAQTWARQNGDPLLFAICGQVNPALLGEMRRVTPPEVARKLQQDHPADATADCTLCLSVHGSSPLCTATIALPERDATFTPPASRATIARLAQQLRLPPSRGPPTYS